MESSRPATPEDVGEVVRLARAMREELAAMRGGTMWLARDARAEPLDDAYRRLLDRADALVVVGAIDRSVVGFGAAEIEPLRGGTRVGVVTELFVEPGARAVGVGEAIAGELVDFCRAQGCAGIDAQALPGHRAAKNFFEAHGFTARALVMHHPLTEPP